MMQSSVADKAVERIVELSADLQIKRRATPKWSLANYDLGVAIHAFGEALEVLTSLQREEEEYPVGVGVFGAVDSPRELSATA
jgi:hypothetical protein